MPDTGRGLPQIPLIDVTTGGALALVDAARPKVEALLDINQRRYGRAILKLGDMLSRAWLVRANNPLRGEIEAIAAKVGRPGAVMLNMSFEWTCTTGAAADPDDSGNRMLRTLDWPLDGLGRNVVVAREAGAAGAYYNITWPGAVGVLTAMAPGRFSAAINQAPMRRYGLTIVGDWMVNRVRVWGSTDLPPMHLLRQVFDQARSYAEAKAMLCETKIALPAFFTLSGTQAHESCLIERLETRAVVHDNAPGAAPISVANDWIDMPISGRPRGHDNPERESQLKASLTSPGTGFAWLTPPVLNKTTRLAVVANAAAGTLKVLGIERDGPATQEFSLKH
jgi:hypothetical protein